MTRGFGLYLGAVFFLSGFASLIYQVVWQRLLTHVYGVGSVSTTIVVSVYMMGLGLGALMGGRVADSTHRWVRYYAGLELCLAVFGLASLPFLGVLGRATAGSSPGVALVASFLFLCIPTTLMGATLPLLVKLYTARSGSFFHSLSVLYFVNTLGAAFGAVFTSYVMISFMGLDTGVYVAAATNLLLAAAVLRLGDSSEEAAAPVPVAESPGSRVNFAGLLVFMTGFMAVGYEMVWFRLLGTLLKASPYTFPSVLAVYLLGVALGSLWVVRFPAGLFGGRRNLFFLLQVGQALSVAGIFLGYFYLSRGTRLGLLTRWTFDRSTYHPALDGGWLGALDVLLWPLFFVLVPTLFMGASFPLISWLGRKEEGREGSTVGGTYFSMILGNVLGGLATGFLLLPLLGTERTLLMFISIGLLFGLLARPLPIWAGVALPLLLVVNLFLFPHRPGSLYYGVIYPPPAPGVNSIAFDEGVDGVVTTYQYGQGISSYIGGMIHGGRSASYYLEALEAVVWSQKVDQVLVIGFGTGHLTEALLACEDIQKITVVELNPTLIENLNRFENPTRILNHHKVELVLDDGRRFLQRTTENYDLVLMDPLRSTTAYSNNLYSREFFELVEAHLNPDGVLMIWLDEFRVMPRTLFSVFEHMRGYWFFCLVSNREFSEPVRPPEPIAGKFPADIQETIPNLHGFVGEREQLEPLCQGYPINSDWKPWCEYYIGLRFLHGPRLGTWGVAE